MNICDTPSLVCPYKRSTGMSCVWAGRVTPWLDHGSVSICPSSSLTLLRDRLFFPAQMKKLGPLDETGICALFVHVPLHLLVSYFNFKQWTCQICSLTLIHLQSVSTFGPCVNTHLYKKLLMLEPNVLNCILFPSCLATGTSSFLFKQCLVLFCKNCFLVCLRFFSTVWLWNFKD